VTSRNLDAHRFKAPQLQSIVAQAVEFFVNTPIVPLPPERFSGPGVYALYFVGTSGLYAPLATQTSTRTRPIYAGKAVTTGWRTARGSVTVKNENLFLRLREHASSIQQASNLDLQDFRCRFMILYGLEMDLIGPVEAELIRIYRPLWNSVIDGFGNHDPGKGRSAQAPSEWDTLHPGRPWVTRLTGQAPDLSQVHEKIQTYFSGLA